LEARNLRMTKLCMTCKPKHYHAEATSCFTFNMEDESNQFLLANAS